MNNWKSQIDEAMPCWADFRALLQRLDGAEFPGPSALNALLPDGAVSRRGPAIRFVPAARLGDVPYEKHIFETGEISTREDSWHDLFNALVWCRLPRLKSAMNAAHYQHLDRARGGRRGRMRDALTLLDESGVVVAGADRELLEALAARDWTRAFVNRRRSWRGATRIIVCGHALLEKMLDPYKSVTAHALLLHVTGAAAGSPGDIPLGDFDRELSARLLAGELFRSPAGLSPLPLMGVPGWWRGGPQDAAFYADRQVFRPRRDPEANGSRLIQDI